MLILCRYTIYYPFEKVNTKAVACVMVKKLMWIRDQFLHVSEANMLCEDTPPVKSAASHASFVKL
jgi:hypothetical protein